MCMEALPQMHARLPSGSMLACMLGVVRRMLHMDAAPVRLARGKITKTLSSVGKRQQQQHKQLLLDSPL